MRLDRMQRVQTLTLRTVPLLMVLIFCRFGCQVRRVLLFAWLTLLPKLGPLPQISHIFDMDYFPPLKTEALIYNKLYYGMQDKFYG